MNETGSGKRQYLACARMLLIGIIILSATAVPALSRPVTVGVYDNHPKLSLNSNGTPVGIFIDILEEIAGREKWTLDYVYCTWAQCLARLEKGEIDLMPDVAYSSERTLKYDFNEVDTVSNWAQVYTHHDTKIRLITDLDNLRVAAMRGGIHLIRFQELIKQFGLELDLVLVEKYDTVFDLIHEKKVDAGIVNRIYGHVNEEKYHVFRSPILFSPATMRFAVKKGENNDLITAIDRQLVHLKKEKKSVYHQSIRRWLGETTQLKLPAWIGWSLAGAVLGITFLFGMSVLFKHQVNKKTADLKETNVQLEKQVSETMRAHRALKRNEKLMGRQERLSTLGQLASGIAHDFNNMIMPILGYTDLLLEDPKMLTDKDNTLSKLKRVRNAAQNARDTVKRLQQFYRIDAKPVMESVSLSDLVAEVVAATKPVWKDLGQARSADITIRQEIPPDLSVTISRSQISDALMNLVLNALHAISLEGSVTIKAFSDDAGFTLQVIDTGTGMTQDVLSRCLVPFYTTKGECGTGMGLAMVKGMVERHGGSLEIESAPEKGTTISMRIPLFQQKESPHQPSDNLLPVPPSLSILVVDDDDHSRDLLLEYLKVDGHKITPVKDAIEALNHLDQTNFDLVITDRAMPKMSGDELARHVKNRDKKKPVLMITGFADVMAAANESPVGVDFLMGKPFTVQELRKAMGACFY